MHPAGKVMQESTTDRRSFAGVVLESRCTSRAPRPGSYKMQLAKSCAQHSSHHLQPKVCPPRRLTQENQLWTFILPI